MGCGSSVSKYAAEEAAKAAAVHEAAKAKVGLEEAQAREREDSEFVFKQFQEFLSAKLLQLTAARDDVAAELRSHSKHDTEYKRTQTAVSHALGALSSLTVIEEERKRRENVNDSGAEQTTWACTTCTTANPVVSALCSVCSRKRFPDERPKTTASVDHATVQVEETTPKLPCVNMRSLPEKCEGWRRLHCRLRKQHLLATAKAQMTAAAASAAAAKMLIVNKRRLRALRTVLKFLDELGRIDTASDLMRDIVTDAETEMMESERQMLLLEQALADRVEAKTGYLRAKGARDFVLAAENAAVFKE